MHIFRFTTLLLLVFCGTSTMAQITIGDTHTFQSAELQEERTLNVYLPEGYSPDSAQTYKVIYLLDGTIGEDFLHIAGLFQFMHMYEIMEPAILVGIANVDRYRDFSYPSSDPEDLESLPTSGGSAAFIRFLKNETFPFIEEHYNTNGERSIIGQSMGGLLATEVLLLQPELFDEYVIVSPSLWWDKEHLVNQAEDLLNAKVYDVDRIFISLGTEHPVMHEVADKLVNALKNSPNQPYSLTFHPLPEEDHATILHFAVYHALRIERPEE